METIKRGSQISLLLDAAVPEDRAEWVSLWSASKFRRPHDHPGFLEAMRAPGERPMAIACLMEGRLLSLYAFNVFDLAQLPFTQELGTSPGVDVISPYGYGGATFEGGDADWTTAEQSLEYALHAFFAQMNVVSEFVREDLFAERLTPRNDGEHLVLQRNIVVDLRVSMEERWRRYSPTVRSSVRHAERAGLRVEIGDGASFLEPFASIYYATMTRDHARQYYFFPLENFRHLHASLQPHGEIQYELIFFKDRAISAELFLLSSDTIYSFLSGTDAAYFRMRPAELLKHKIIAWGHEQGYQSLVVGGGLKADDGLFQFKRKFEPLGLVDFQVRRVVWNREQHDLLVAARERWELEQGKTWRAEPDFFPAYRADSSTGAPREAI